MTNQVIYSITRDDVLEAIRDLNSGATHGFRDSTRYDLLIDGKRYAPKAVVGLAARRQLGRPLVPEEFSGGLDSQCFKILEKLGFTVVAKDTEQQAGADKSKANGELPKETKVAVWLEMTKTRHEHGGPGWEFGTCLWSPTEANDGKDWYASMREAKVDDIVIHSNDSRLVGYSFVARPCTDLAGSPPNPGKWGGRERYYRMRIVFTASVVAFGLILAALPRVLAQADDEQPTLTKSTLDGWLAGQVPALKLKLAAAKKGPINPRAAKNPVNWLERGRHYIFRSRVDKDLVIRRLESEVKSPTLPRLWPFDLKVGQVGSFIDPWEVIGLEDAGDGLAIRPTYSVLQILEGDTALLSAETRDHTTRFFLISKLVRELQEGQVRRTLPGSFIVEGKRQYETVLGAASTIPVVRDYDLTPHLKQLAETSRRTTKHKRASRAKH